MVGLFQIMTACIDKENKWQVEKINYKPVTPNENILYLKFFNVEIFFGGGKEVGSFSEN